MIEVLAMGKYSKSIMAFLMSAGGMGAMLGLDIPAIEPELIAAVSTVASAVVVWAVPNKES